MREAQLHNSCVGAQPSCAKVTLVTAKLTTKLTAKLITDSPLPATGLLLLTLYQY